VDFQPAIRQNEAIPFQGDFVDFLLGRIVTRLLLFIVAIASMCAAIPAADVTSTWDGTSNNWSSAHWSSPDFPNNGNGGFTYDAVITNGTVKLDQDITIESLALSLGTINATTPSNLTINDQLNWNGGSFLGNGQLTIGSTANASISNAAGGFNFLGTFVNEGHTVWTGTHPFYAQGTIQNNANLDLDFSTATPLNVFMSGNRFNNAGAIVKKGSGTISIESNYGFYNTGTVDVQQGTLILAYSGTHTGDFTGAAGATLNIGGGQTFAAGSDITGELNVTFSASSGKTITDHGLVNLTGALAFSGSGTHAMNGAVSANSISVAASIGGVTTLAGPTTASQINVSSGTGTFSGDASATAVGVTGGTMNVKGTMQTSTASISGGTVGGTGTITIGNNLNWTGGNMTGTGVTVLPPGATFPSAGSSSRVLSRTLINNSNLSYAGLVTLSFSKGTFQNNGIFTTGSTAAFSNNGSTPNNFNNAGSFVKNGGQDVTFSGVQFNNSGTLNVNGGKMNLLGGGSHTGDFTGVSGTTLVFGGGHTFASGSDISGATDVTFTGSATSNGNVNITGVLTISGVRVGLNGAVTVPKVVITSGNVSFGGSLTLAQPLTITTGLVSINSPISLTDVELAGGELGGRNVLTVSNSLSWTRGNMGGSGRTVIASGASLSIDPRVTINLSRTIVNDGITTLTSSRGITMTQGTFKNHNVFTATCTAATPIIGNGTITSLFENTGTFVKLGASSLTFTYTLFTSSGVVDVQAGTLDLGNGVAQQAVDQLSIGTWKVRDDSTLKFGTLPGITTSYANVILEGPNSQFSSINTLTKNHGRFTILSGRDFTAQGAFDNFGTLTIGAGSAFSAPSGLTQFVSSRLQGGGIVHGNVQNSGTVAPGDSPGILTIDGDYSQVSAGVLEIEIGGLDRGNQYDALVVTGTAAFGATLRVLLTSSYTPVIGHQFDILDWTYRTGAFTTLQLPSLPTDMMWNKGELYTAGVLGVSLAGDFDSNGSVDASDYVLLRKGLGVFYTSDDLNLWRSHFGQSVGSGSALGSAIPEPSTLLGAWLLFAAHGLGGSLRTRK